MFLLFLFLDIVLVGLSDLLNWDFGGMPCVRVCICFYLFFDLLILNGVQYALFIIPSQYSYLVVCCITSRS